MPVCAIIFLSLLWQNEAGSRFMAVQGAAEKDTGVSKGIYESHASIPVLPKLPPQSGDLVKQVKVQLASDHRTLGQISASLMSVQTEVDRTEQSMLGKVLDLQTARSFFVRHQEIGTANEKLKDDVSMLNSQVEDLSSSLNKVQRKFLTNGHVYREAEGKLHEVIVEDKTLIQNMDAELTKEDDVHQALKKLTQIHQDLLGEAVEAKNAGERADNLLKDARVESAREVSKHKLLRHQLVQMNNYSVACHSKVEKVSKKLGQLMLKESQDNKAAMMTMRQAQKANTATKQRLLAERALLVSEVKKYDFDTVQELGRLKDLREDYATLQASIAREIQNVKDDLVAEQERFKNLKKSLFENEQATEEDLGKKEIADTEIEKLAKQLRDEQNPILIATLEGQNKALEVELEEGYKFWTSVKQNESAAVLEAQDANNQLEAEQKGIKLAQDGLDSARNEGEKQVGKATAEAADDIAKSKDLLNKAQAALTEKCSSKWDEIEKEKTAKLYECQVLQKDLIVAQAEKESLANTLKAKASLESASL